MVPLFDMGPGISPADLLAGCSPRGKEAGVTTWLGEQLVVWGVPRMPPPRWREYLEHAWCFAQGRDRRRERARAVRECGWLR